MRGSIRSECISVKCDRKKVVPCSNAALMEEIKVRPLEEKGSLVQESARKRERCLPAWEVCGCDNAIETGCQKLATSNSNM